MSEQQLAFVPTEQLTSDIEKVEKEVQRLKDFSKGLDQQGFISQGVNALVTDVEKQMLLAKRERALREGPLAGLYGQFQTASPIEAVEAEKV